MTSASVAQAPAGLAVGSCVVTLYGSPAVITAPAAGGYQIRFQHGGLGQVAHYAGLKAAPCPGETTASPPAARPAAATLPSPPAVRAAEIASAATLGPYHCVLFIPGSGLVTQSGFTLLPGGRYAHQLGGGGTTRVSNGVIEFTGGPLTGQAGKISAGRVNLYNASRTRTVIDCDTKG